jgi:rod shape-determining protein MreC
MSADRRRRRTLLGVLVLVSLVLITLDFRQGDDGPLDTAQDLALAAFAPVQAGVDAVVRPIGGFFSSIGQLGRLREDNAALREALNMGERLDLTTSAARVIGQPPGAFRWSVLIDVGTDNGVQRNMAVVNADGFVGKVTDVTATHARVQLAASPTAGYAVRVAESGQQGLVQGRGSRPLEMFIIDDPETIIPEGSEVVTRAFQGGSIPDGIPFGSVAGQSEGGTERAQFLDVVLVVLDAPVMPVDLEPEEAEDDPDLPEDLEDALDGAAPETEEAAVGPRRRPAVRVGT